MIGEGRVGLYIDTSTLTICTEDGVREIDLSKDVPDFSADIAECQRIMDAASRRANPDNYNEDGTIKNGIMVDGKRCRLRWVRTKAYNDARNKKVNLQRVESEQRSLQRHILANYVLSLGDEIVVNDYPFQYAAERRKFPEGEDKTPSGRNKKKRKKGVEVGHNAPGMLIALIDRKLKSAGYQGVEKIKLKDIEYNTPGYRHYYAMQFYDKTVA